MAASKARVNFVVTFLRNRITVRKLCPVTRFEKVAFTSGVKEEVKEVAPSRAEMAYTAKKSAYDALFKKEVEEFERGKRHLANMMGEDPENFSQKDIDDTYAKLLEVQEIENNKLSKGIFDADEPLYLTRSVWIEKNALEKIVLENISNHDYNRFIRLLERIIQQPYAKHAQDYIMQFRKDIVAVTSKDVVDPIKHDENGIGYAEADGSRKRAKAHVVVREKGTGIVKINGKDLIDYFWNIQDREQIMFPFQFVDKLGEFDMECTVTGGGLSGQAGAIRLASSRALRSFVNEEQIEHMRQAGLLTQDPRIVERKKPGQKGARKKFTWKKR
uniref:28S ribosomal protein S9, mitochondrial-like n=1 Tax=Saccoglossus kowalevskii TaxID=10224 RepID=A0ABM0MZR8_SACKO|nr:PREDICTED: 28S ribosomal protein S9, mitochondrial-like [Saccoglossus kowalevskii]